MRLFAAVIALGTVVALPLTAQSGGCGDTKYPSHLPAPSALVDSTHAIADLAAFAGSKPMLFSLVFAIGDSVPQVRALDRNDEAAAIALINYLKHQPPGPMWAIRVRIAGGDAPSLMLERSQYCPPEPLSKRIPTMAIAGSITTRGQAATPIMSSGAKAEALIGADGNIIRVQVIGTTGSPQADYSFRMEIQRHRFKPAQLDGEAVAGMWRSDGLSPRP